MTSAIATANFNYRHTAVLYCTLPIAAAIGITQLVMIRRRSEEPAPVSAPATSRRSRRVGSPRARARSGAPS
jgi:hypothetical protein